MAVMVEMCGLSSAFFSTHTVRVVVVVVVAISHTSQQVDNERCDLMMRDDIKKYPNTKESYVRLLRSTVNSKDFPGHVRVK